MIAWWKLLDDRLLWSPLSSARCLLQWWWSSIVRNGCGVGDGCACLVAVVALKNWDVEEVLVLSDKQGQQLRREMCQQRSLMPFERRTPGLGTLWLKEEDHLANVFCPSVVSRGDPDVRGTNCSLLSRKSWSCVIHYLLRPYVPIAVRLVVVDSAGWGDPMKGQMAPVNIGT
jgi:hypothetical protein